MRSSAILVASPGTPPRGTVTRRIFFSSIIGSLTVGGTHEIVTSARSKGAGDMAIAVGRS